ncbi:hypothetical protein [Natronobiforma cellulositropha]|uniref:hypothetical protein n=1 Tax=Natronobiforma cellulositropha TaxID=1679076 RepID=UPI0021D5A7A8|nr:hypothetical protein [Natronobiforma cellulositropha]
MDESRTVHWRRDATTSRTVRALWALGAGTFFAMISLIVFWRLFGLAGQIGDETVALPSADPSTLALSTTSLTLVQATLLAALGGLAATILALAAAGNTERRLERLTRSLPLTPPSDAALRRTMDAAVGTVVMGAVIGGLIGAGRFVAQGDLLATGAGPFTGLAAATLPLALIALVLSSFLQSVGTLDLEAGVLYLHDPEAAIELETLVAVSSRDVGDVSVLTLAYDQPDGQYVAGPRRLVVPPRVAHELESRVGPVT